MVFNSFTFLVFFVLVACCFRVARLWTARKLVLLVASYLFYGSFNPPYVLLLVVSTLVDWYAARKLISHSRLHLRRLGLVVSLASNLGMLAVFKYANFLAEISVDALALVGVVIEPAQWSIVLPVGISFYTFQTLSFSIDVYRGRINPSEVTLTDFALYVAFFPQLVAGPIVRAAEFLPQLALPRMPTPQGIRWGIVMLTVGVFQKTVLADVILAPVADLVFASDHASLRDSWVGALAFSCQIFFDFAGYSTCAIGVAMCFGFELPDNFRRPYGATGFSDFWRRWHISLSSWLRDYLYISLGGNRRGRVRTLVNLMVTMLLGGMWHGASWNFVLWGALHGAFLVVERAAGGASNWLTTQLFVLLAWVPFRSSTFDRTLEYFTSLVVPRSTESVVSLANAALVLAICAITYSAQRLLRDSSLEDLARGMRDRTVVSCLALSWLAIWLAHPPDRAFIYFQF